MLLIYNLLLITIPIICLPCLVVLLIYVSLTPKYRGRFMHRLGCGLSERVSSLPVGRKRIWIHALSVGEVSSARTLVRGLRKKYPDVSLVFSASTRSGEAYAVSTLNDDVDLFIPFPLDLYWTTEKFVKTVNPDLFILVETDLWPNFLGSIRRHNVLSVLVNGRMSKESFNNYRKLQFLCSPMLNTFDALTLQTDEEKSKMMELGVNDGKIKQLGNLKYDGLVTVGRDERAGNVPAATMEGKRILVAGSTHSGEEGILLKAFTLLRERFSDLYLVLAPRNVERGEEILTLAEKLGVSAMLRSKGGGLTGDMLILDTLGELAGFYEICDAAYVGGSLVEQRGHNPLEPAALGKPVIFGPHMEDFQEIADDLLSCGGAVRVVDVGSIVDIVGNWFATDSIASEAGQKGMELVLSMRGVTERHLKLIDNLLNRKEVL